MRRLPAILMMIFLVCPLFYAALTTIGVSTWALSRGFYVGILGNTGLYEIPDAVSSATWREIDIPGLEGLSFRTSGKAMREILSPAYMQSQAVSVANQVFDILDGRGRAADIIIDLAPVKTALLGDAGRRFASALARDLPVAGTTADFAIRPGRLPASRPSSLTVERAARLIEGGLPVFVRSMPDTLRLGDNPQFHEPPFEWGWRPRVSLPGLLISAGIILFLIAGGLWVAAAFIGGATPFERLQWLGWSLFAPAACVFLMGLFVTLSFFSGWVQWGIESARLATHGFSASFTTAVIDVARRVMVRVGTGFLATGAIAAGTAMGLLAWGWSIPQSERKGELA